MSKEQIDLWNRYAARGVCIDATFNLSKHKFKLVTVMVLGPQERGIPVASLLCSTENTAMLHVFFEAIKTKVTSLTYAVIMSDDASRYYNAFKAVFNCERKLLCTVHVVRSWSNYVKRLVEAQPHTHPRTTAEIVRSMVRLSRAIAECRDEFQEQSAIDALVSEAHQYGLGAYLTYFERTYLRRKEQWMARFRKYSPVNTNNNCESYHAKIRRVFTDKGYWHGRVDRVVYNLVSFNNNRIKDLFYHQSDSYRMRKVMQAHHNCVKDVDMIKNIQVESATVWIVPSSDHQYTTYKVKRISGSPCCDMICKVCLQCKHQFKCDCTILKFETNAFCCHVHAVCMAYFPTKPGCAVEQHVEPVEQHVPLEQHVEQPASIDLSRRDLSACLLHLGSNLESILSSLPADVEEAMCAKVRDIASMINFTPP